LRRAYNGTSRTVRMGAGKYKQRGLCFRDAPHATGTGEWEWRTPLRVVDSSTESCTWNARSVQVQETHALPLASWHRLKATLSST
jgi:hypothetical protein